MSKSLSSTLRGTNYGTLPVLNGGTGVTTSTGTTNLVLSNGPTLDSPRILTVALIGPSSAANLTRFPNSLTAISNTAAGIQKNEAHNIGLVAEGTAHATDTTIYGVGVYGKGYTNAATRSGGVVGEGHVSATGDTGSAIGVRGYANDTHAGGMNIGLYADANNGANNYALYMNSGNITNVAAQTWTLGGNLTFSGAYSVTIPTLSLSNALPVASGGTGLTNPGTAGNVLTSNGTAWVSQAASILAWQSVKTANFTASSFMAYPVDTTSGAITVTLPASPVINDVITFVDYAGTFATNALTINPNGNKVDGDTSNQWVNTNRAYLNLLYVNSTQGWITISNTIPVSPYYSVTTLVVGGGGGGGGTASFSGSAGGGGGGGYRCSVPGELSGGGNSAESPINLLTGQSYNVIVGAGGTGATSGSRVVATSGNNSSLSTITAIGGGGGGASQATNGTAGGSGGGGGYIYSGGLGTSGQGYAGGAGGNGSPYGGGGGGGAGAVGSSANTSPSGGAGVTSMITGTATYRAGGGGAGCEQAAGGSGGIGGGGSGGRDSIGLPGTANTGGGGGGAGGGANASAGGNGGSGIVIISYAGSQRGTGGTVTSVGGKTIHTFTSSGTYIA